MRSIMDNQLDEMHKEIIAMGKLCIEAIDNAINALISNDPSAAEKAMNFDAVIDKKEREIEALCLNIMLRHHPVAKDLRQVSSALKMITDMERIGDQARDIAEITQFVTIDNISQIKDLKFMADATSEMLNESILAFVNSDLDLAHKVIKDDDVIDNYFVEIKDKLVKEIREDGDLAEQSLDILMIAKYFERIGDHATNIAEWVEFAITGIHHKYN